ncbi:MAG: hypothetical protein AAF394_10335, partial [Planctomycetota bacterium]
QRLSEGRGKKGVEDLHTLTACLVMQQEKLLVYQGVLLITLRLDRFTALLLILLHVSQEIAKEQSLSFPNSIESRKIRIAVV